MHNLQPPVANWIKENRPIDPENGNYRAIIWPDSLLEIQGFDTIPSIQQIDTIGPKIHPQYLEKELEEELKTSFQAFNGLSHSLAEEIHQESFRQPYDIEFGWAIGYDTFQDRTNEERLSEGEIGKQVENIEKNLETSSKWLEEDGIFIWNIDGFSQYLNPEFGGENNYSEFQERYAELITNLAEEYFEESEIIRDIEPESNTLYVMGQKPR